MEYAFYVQNLSFWGSHQSEGGEPSKGLLHSWEREKPGGVHSEHGLSAPGRLGAPKDTFGEQSGRALSKLVLGASLDINAPPGAS